MKKIVFTGGTGRFAKVFKSIKNRYKIEYPSKAKLNIEKFDSIKSYLKKNKPNYLIHCAGLSRPMKIHDDDISRSILINIIGTSNIVRACKEKNIKLIYFSTNYVYQGNKGNYKETDPLLPVNNYAWSKLGGETSVQLYNNSLILRLSMTEKPFVHKKAFTNVKTSFLYHEDVVKILFKILNKRGVVNVGGKAQFIYNFAKKDNPDLKKQFLRNKSKHEIPIDSSINLLKLRKILKKEL